MTNITIPKKVAEQVLEALGSARVKYDFHGNPLDACDKGVIDAADALYAALEQSKVRTNWAKTVRLAKVALHEMPRPHTDWMEAAKAVCESVVKVGHSQEEKQLVEQTPLAWMYIVDGEDEPRLHFYEPLAASNVSGITPLYTRQQPPVEQEPVSEITGMDEYGPMLGWHIPWAEFPVGTKLYTNPQPPRQPLTRKKVQELVIEVCDTLYPQGESSYSEADSVFYTTFVRVVERAHNINHEGEEA